jgi:hypothetical protein
MRARQNAVYSQNGYPEVCKTYVQHVECQLPVLLVSIWHGLVLTLFREKPPF